MKMKKKVEGGGGERTLRGVNIRNAHPHMRTLLSFFCWLFCCVFAFCMVWSALVDAVCLLLNECFFYATVSHKCKAFDTLRCPHALCLFCCLLTCFSSLSLSFFLSCGLQTGPWALLPFLSVCVFYFLSASHGHLIAFALRCITESTMS